MSKEKRILDAQDSLSSELLLLKDRPDLVMQWLKDNHPSTIVSILTAGQEGIRTTFAAFPFAAKQVYGSIILSCRNEAVIDFVSAFSDLFGLGDFPDEAFFDLQEKMRGLCAGYPLAEGFDFPPSRPGFQEILFALKEPDPFLALCQLFEVHQTLGPIELNQIQIHILIGVYPGDDLWCSYSEEFWIQGYEKIERYKVGLVRKTEDQSGPFMRWLACALAMAQAWKIQPYFYRARKHDSSSWDHWLMFEWLTDEYGLIGAIQKDMG